MSSTNEKRPNKEEMECRTLRTVFSTDDYPDLCVKHRESPDFTLERDGRRIGVEITSTYRSDAAARAANIPGYWQGIMDSGRYFNKSDKNFLIPATTDDGTKVMMQLVKDLEERPNTLAAAIREKTSKNYSLSEFQSAQLIVLDHLDQPFVADDYDIASIINNSTRAALLSSPFDEVYLVVRLNPGIGWAYLRCQELLLFDYWSRFLWACSELPPGKKFAHTDLCEMFGSFCREISPGFRMAEVDGQPAICYRDKALLLSDSTHEFTTIPLDRARRVATRNPRLVATAVDLRSLFRIAYGVQVVGPRADNSPHQLWESRGGHITPQH